jgi:two-component system chemotaxis sensor kinase CheA
MNSDDEEILAQAREGFLDEARELLQQFEQALLSMEQDPADSEATNTAFRAAHTIKGTAGLFGFEAVVAFTHEVESLLEDLRSAVLALNDDAMGLLLQGRDQIERLLADIDSSEPDAALAARSTVLAAQLRSCRGAPEAEAAQAPAAAAASASAAGAVSAAPKAAGLWHLSLRIGADALRNGLDPLSFIRYLSTVGQVSAVRTVADTIPELAELDPDECHLGFELRLLSDAPRASIATIFDFLAQDCDFVLLAPDAGDRDYLELLERRAASPVQRASLLALWHEIGVPEPATAPAPAVAAVVAAGAAEPVALQAAERRQGGGERRAAAAERRGGEETRFIRVRADKLDHLVDLVGELVIAGSGAQLIAQEEQSPRFAEAAQRIHDLVQDVRDGALGLRMVPVGDTFSRFNRVVRDVGKQLDKEVELQISGGDTELDKSMVETIADPLMHLVRNSLDHGIEPAAERLAAGKPAAGRLGLHAYHDSGAVVIEVSDDGRGLDCARLLAKAIERGIVAADAELADLGEEAVHNLIFHPGFSTAAQVTNLSGRGVGMDVVKRNVESLRGQIRVASLPGQGTTIQVRLPLTLAIIDGFLTGVGGVTYVLPLDLVAECLALPPECSAAPERVAGHFQLRGAVVPYLDLARFYRHARADAGDGSDSARRSVVLVRDGDKRMGLVVDRLLGEHQTVIKPMGEALREARGLSGSTILGSGEVALILDVPVLLDLATGRLAEAGAGAARAGRAARHEALAAR